MLKIIKNCKFDRIFNELMCFNISLYIFTTMLSDSEIGNLVYIKGILHLFIWITFFLPMFKIFYDFLRGKFLLFESAIYFILSFLGFYLWIRSGRGEPFVFILYIIACQDVDIKKFLKYSFFSLSFTLFLIIFLSFITKYKGIDKVDYRYGVTTIRYGLGFIYTTISAHYFLSIVILSVFLFDNKNVFYYLTIIFFNIFLFLFTDTKSVFICCFVALFLVFILKYLNQFFVNLFGLMTIISFPLGAIFIIWVSYFYDEYNIFLNFLNKILTNRIILGYRGFKVWEIKLFGDNINMSTSIDNYNFIDSSYLNILFNFGVLFLILVIIIFAIYSYIAKKSNNVSLLICLFIISIHSIFDTQLIYIVYNPIAAFFLLYFKNYYKRLDTIDKINK